MKSKIQSWSFDSGNGTCTIHLRCHQRLHAALQYFFGLWTSWVEQRCLGSKIVVGKIQRLRSTRQNHVKFCTHDSVKGQEWYSRSGLDFAALVIDQIKSVNEQNYWRYDQTLTLPLYFIKFWIVLQKLFNFATFW